MKLLTDYTNRIPGHLVDHALIGACISSMAFAALSIIDASNPIRLFTPMVFFVIGAAFWSYQKNKTPIPHMTFWIGAVVAAGFSVFWPVLGLSSGICFYIGREFQSAHYNKRYTHWDWLVTVISVGLVTATCILAFNLAVL